MAVVLYLSIISAAIGKMWSVLISLIAILVYLHFYIRAKKVSRLNYLYVLFHILFYFYAANQMQPSVINSYIDEVNKTDAVVRGTVKSVEKSSFGVNIKLENCDVSITVENVLEADLSEESTSLKNSSAENISSQSMSAQNLGLLISVYDDNLSADCIEGAVIEVKGMLAAFNSVRNSGQFDAKRYYKSIGIDYRMSAKEISVINKSEQFNYYIKALREKLQNIYTSIMDEKDNSVIKAVLLGDKTGLDEEMYNLYQKNGIAHLLAISGLHISFIGMLVYRFMRRAGMNYAASFCISSLFLAVYLIMTGNGISAKRAVIMCMINMGADVLGRNYDILSALSLAAIIAAFENVNVIYNSGFLLSFGAMLGIALLSPMLDRMFLSEYRKKTEDYDRKM